MANTETEIIDLTEEPTEPAVVVQTTPDFIVVPSDSEPEAGEIDSKESTVNPEVKKSRRKKRKKKSLVPDTPNSRKEGREDATDRGEGPSHSRHDAEPSPKRRKRSLTPTGDEQSSFFIDLNPVPVPSSSQHAVANPKDAANDDVAKLLLPSHVQVFGSVPVEIIHAPKDEDEDFIDYLDYDSNVRKVRLTCY